MVQAEILNFLSGRKQKGEEWCSVPEIKDHLVSIGYGNGTIQKIHNTLFQLSAFDCIEFKGQGLWEHKKLFRIK